MSRSPGPVPLPCPDRSLCPWLLCPGCVGWPSYGAARNSHPEEQKDPHGSRAARAGGPRAALPCGADVFSKAFCSQHLLEMLRAAGSPGTPRHKGSVCAAPRQGRIQPRSWAATSGPAGRFSFQKGAELLLLVAISTQLRTRASQRIPGRDFEGTCWALDINSGSVTLPIMRKVTNGGSNLGKQ